MMESLQIYWHLIAFFYVSLKTILYCALVSSLIGCFLAELPIFDDWTFHSNQKHFIGCLCNFGA